VKLVILFVVDQRHNQAPDAALLGTMQATQDALSLKGALRMRFVAHSHQTIAERGIAVA